MKWFKHDTDASIDAKLQELLLDYGASGYGLYWYCVELIAQNINDSNITFELEHDARIIARNLNLTVQETKDMMQKMINLELFSISKNNKLACYALANRLDQSMTSSPKFRNLISRIKENSHDFIMTKSTISHDKVMQEEKRREKKRKEEIRLEEKEYIVDEKLELAKRTIDFLNKTINKNFGYTDGNLKEIKSQVNKLLKSGDDLSAIEDKFAHVVKVKCSEWKNNQEMKKHLNPITLFRESNFDKYLNQDMTFSTIDLVNQIYEVRDAR